MTPASSFTTTDTARYVFGLMLGTACPKLVGFGDAPLEIVFEQDGISAVGCEVSLDEFGQDVVSERMEDMDWVGEIATIHFATCDKIFQESKNFLPFRLFTVFSSPQAVQDLLTARFKDFQSEFQRLEGKAEFGLKIWAKEEWLDTFALRNDKNLQTLYAQTNQSGGKSFFSAKKYELAMAEAKKKLAPQLGQRLAGTLKNVFSLSPEQMKTLSLPAVGVKGFLPLINLSLLLGRDRLEELKLMAERLDREALGGGLVEAIGPLPPYSFINLGEEAM
ncbi:MAG: GvpL/GvpF family gas vesicle protein [Chloroflexi bacterium]|uniref:GvpL/GvpF family gas vesicle protein n=1 Tax=Candidatus Chlorohelix allophototropha TaxID=3003348 RepID=A0A8T7M6R8_9CHLR|nr:GvpL/GvpF family gas vesicle protein [Chloroflexota bacterium]WJW69739.1 GvpL/GvpF family gas vesicle protein [Chloroflexota bacterium L227-S17]